MIRHLAQMLLVRDGKVLLGIKKTGFGTGKLVCPGGKVESGETETQAAIRETEEEVGIKVKSCEKVAQVIFRNLYYKGEPETDIMHVFISDDFEGEAATTSELTPEWFPIDQIPYDKMWGDAKHWMPDALRRKKTDSFFRYNDQNEFTEFSVNMIPDILIASFRDSDFGFPEDKDESSFAERNAAVRPQYNRGILKRGAAHRCSCFMAYLIRLTAEDKYSPCTHKRSSVHSKADISHLPV